MTAPLVFSAPTPAQHQLLAAARTRLSVDYPWAVAAVFRAVPVRVHDQTSAETGDGAEVEVSTDRWGRLYLAGPLETLGVAQLATKILHAVLEWVSGTGADQPWHLHRLNDQFPPVPTAQAHRAAHTAAAGISRIRRPYGGDELDRWREWANKVVGPPQLSWQQQLGGQLRSAIASRPGHDVRTYARPSRRSQPNLLLPASRSHPLNVAVLVDISGSVTDQIPVLLAEIDGIVASVGLRGGTVRIITVDDEVVETVTSPARPEHYGPRSGHGTDLRAGFTHLTQAGSSGGRYDVVVVLTDGATPWPEHRPAAGAIVALVGERTITEQQAEKVPAWARVLHLDPAVLRSADD